MDAEVKQKTISGIGWGIIARISKQAVQFLISVILARLLTPTDFGLVGMVTVFTGFATLFAEMGFGAALVQAKNVEDRLYSSVFWLNISIGILLVGIAWLTAPFIASFYNEKRLLPIILITASNFVISSLYIVQNSILNRALKFKFLSTVEVCSVIVSGTVAVLMAYLGMGVYALVGQMLVASGVWVGMTWKESRWIPRLYFNYKDIKQLMNFSSNLFGFNIFNYWTRNADNLLIGKVVGSTGLGIYTRAYMTMLIPLNQISTVISSVMFPVLSKYQDDIQQVKAVYLRTIRMIALVSFPLMLGLFVVARPFVLVLFGQKWEGVIPVLQILSLVGLAQSISSSTGWIYQALGRTNWMFRWGVGAGLVTLLSFIIGIRWGVEGVAWAYAISRIPLTYFNFYFCGKLIDIRFRDVFHNVSSVLFCAIIMASCIWFFSKLIPNELATYIVLFTQVLVGVLIYWGSLHFWQVESYLDLSRMVVSFFGSKEFNIFLHAKKRHG